MLTQLVANCSLRLVHQVPNPMGGGGGSAPTTTKMLMGNPAKEDLLVSLKVTASLRLALLIDELI